MSGWETASKRLLCTTLTSQLQRQLSDALPPEKQWHINGSPTASNRGPTCGSHSAGALPVFSSASPTRGVTDKKELLGNVDDAA